MRTPWTYFMEYMRKHCSKTYQSTTLTEFSFDSNSKFQIQKMKIMMFVEKLCAIDAFQWIMYTSLLSMICFDQNYPANQAIVLHPIQKLCCIKLNNSHINIDCIIPMRCIDVLHQMKSIQSATKFWIMEKKETCSVRPRVEKQYYANTFSLTLPYHVSWLRRMLYTMCIRALALASCV